MKTNQMLTSMNLLVSKHICKTNYSTKFPCKIKNQTLIHYHIKNEYADYSKISAFQLAKLNDFLSWYRQNPVLKLNDLKRSNTEEYNRVIALKPKPTIISMEFKPVYTAGKKFMKSVQDVEKVSNPYTTFMPKSKTMLDDKIRADHLGTKKQDPLEPEFQLINRGGKITYHGPGQLVMYFVFDLKDFSNLDIRKYISLLEKVLKEFALSRTLDCVSYNDEVGVFIKSKKDAKIRKLASIGINIQKLVTTHGISINLNNNLEYLNQFEMCGLGNLKQSSFFNELSEVHSAESVAKTIVQRVNAELDNLEIDYRKVDENDL